MFQILFTCKLCRAFPPLRDGRYKSPDAKNLYAAVIGPPLHKNTSHFTRVMNFIIVQNGYNDIPSKGVTVESHFGLNVIH